MCIIEVNLCSVTCEKYMYLSKIKDARMSSSKMLHQIINWYQRNTTVNHTNSKSYVDCLVQDCIVNALELLQPLHKVLDVT